MKKLSIIIVNYNVCYFLEQAIKSVYRAVEHLDAEIIVVDNNSVDGSVELVREKFPEVILIANSKNVGFSKANNQGIKIAQGKYILLLNPDTVVEENTLVDCCTFMDEHPDAGGLGVQMVDGSGVYLPESKRAFPSPLVAFYKIFGLSALFPHSKVFGRYHLGYLDRHKTHQVDVLAGAFMMLRSNVLHQIGGLDEDYFMYGEDIDLSYKILQQGYKNYYYPDARIIHYKGESTKKTSVNYVFIFYQAMIIFAKKHFSQKNAFLFSFLIHIAIYLKASFDIARNWLSSSILSIVDAGVIFTGMYFLKSYWELNHKPDPGLYPHEFMEIAVPCYIVSWLLSNHYSGGNDKPYNIEKMIQGALLGTIIISAFSNFFDPYRFSKALIVLGGGVAFTSILLNRILFHALRFKNLAFTKSTTKRIALVGEVDEVTRVTHLINELEISAHVVGFVHTQSSIPSTKIQVLGKLDQLDEVVEIHKIDEIIFCSKNISAARIIEIMTQARNKMIEYKIVPDESNYIIGSNSKNSPGDFYAIDVKLGIAESRNIRNKRLIDVVVSLTFCVSLPLIIWAVDRKWNFIQNIVRVLTGGYSWVGFASQQSVNLPGIKKGILSPTAVRKSENLDSVTIKKLDVLYAKEYNISSDLNIILRSLSHLGD